MTVTLTSGLADEKKRDGAKSKIKSWADITEEVLGTGEWTFHVTPKPGCECVLCTAIGKVRDAMPGLPLVSGSSVTMKPSAAA